LEQTDLEVDDPKVGIADALCEEWSLSEDELATKRNEWVS
jgi:hypothetical protein